MARNRNRIKRRTRRAHTQRPIGRSHNGRFTPTINPHDNNVDLVPAPIPDDGITPPFPSPRSGQGGTEYLVTAILTGKVNATVSLQPGGGGSVMGSSEHGPFEDCGEHVQPGGG